MGQRQKRRRRAHRLIRKVITFLREDDTWMVRLEKLEGPTRERLGHGDGEQATLYGVCDYETDEIFLDYRHKDVIATLIHEVLHAMYPDMPHLRVYKLEREAMRHITPRQCEAIWFYAGFRMKGR